MNFHIRPHWPLRMRPFPLAAMLLAVLSATHGAHAAGESQAVTASKLVGIALPQGAERILDAKVVRQSVAPLSTVAANLDATTQVQATEVLAWGGPGHKREKGRAIMARVQATLREARFETQKLGDPQAAQGNTISFFFVDSIAQKKAFLGYWFENDALLTLVWGS